MAPLPKAPGQRIERGVLLPQSALQGGLALGEFQPAPEHGGLVLRLLVALDLLQACGDLGFGDPVERAEGGFLAAVLLL